MRRATTASLLLLTLAACSSTKVSVDYDEAYDFAGGTTYAWTEGLPAENELNQERIEQAVDAALSQRGYRRQEGGTPELLVYTEVARHQEVRSTGTGLHLGVGRSFGSGGLGVGTTVGDRVYEVTVGTLVISIVDAESDRLVWRASSDRTITDDREKTKQAIQSAVAQAFKKFPPDKKD